MAPNEAPRALSINIIVQIIYHCRLQQINKTDITAMVRIVL